MRPGTPVLLEKQTLHPLTEILDDLLPRFDTAIHPHFTPRAVTDGYPADMRQDISPVLYCGDVAYLPPDVASLFNFDPLPTYSDAYLIYETNMVRQCRQATDVSGTALMLELATRSTWEKLQYRLQAQHGEYSPTLHLTAADIWKAAGSPADKPMHEVETALHIMTNQLSVFKPYYAQTMQLSPTDPRRDAIAMWRVKSTAEMHVLGMISRVLADQGTAAVINFIKACASLAEAKVK